MTHQLFIDFDFPENEKDIPAWEIETSKLGPLHMVLNQYLNFTSRFQQPIVRPYTSVMPKEVKALYRISNNSKVYDRVCPHFFTKDENIEPAWTKPFSYWLKLKKFGKAISTDLSIYENMVDEQKRWNSFRNKFLTALWQYLGIDMIPAPSWGNNLADIDFYLEGWPKHSLIAINSTGVGTDRHSKHLFLDGYSAMLEILSPTHILRYGACIKGERTDISTYFPNDARKEVAYGCK